MLRDNFSFDFCLSYKVQSYFIKAKFSLTVTSKTTDCFNRVLNMSTLHQLKHGSYLKTDLQLSSLRRICQAYLKHQ